MFQVYNNADFRLLFFGLLFCAQAFAGVAAIIFYLKYAKPDGKKLKTEKLLQATTDKKVDDSKEVTTEAKKSILTQDHNNMSESVM